MTLREALKATDDPNIRGHRGAGGTTIWVSVSMRERLKALAKDLRVSQVHLTDALLLMCLTKFEGKKCGALSERGHMMATRAEQYREHLRGFLRDKEEFNFLTGVEEFPDAELEKCFELRSNRMEHHTTADRECHRREPSSTEPADTRCGPLDRHLGQFSLGAKSACLL